MKCACRDPECTTEVFFDAESGAMIVERKDATILVYLDANACIELIQGLRRVLNRMTEKQSDYPLRA